MKNSVLRRILSIFLACLMVLPLSTFTSFAEGELQTGEQSEYEEQVVELEENQLENFASVAVNSPFYMGDETIYTGQDIVFPENSVISDPLSDDDMIIGIQEEIFPDGSTSTDSEDETLGSMFDVQQDENGMVLDDNVVTELVSAEMGAESTPYVTISSSSLSIPVGGSSTITVSCGGFSGKTNLQVCRSDASISCTWGSWTGNSVPLTIRRTSGGASYVYVYLKSASSGNTLASAKVKVTTSTVTLSTSVSSVQGKVGQTTSVTVSFSGYSSRVCVQYGTTNSSVYSCSWGSWTNNGRSVPLKIRGENIGTGKITIYLKDYNSKATLASKTISVSVVNPNPPKVTLLHNGSATGSVSIYEGDTIQIRARCTNWSGKVSTQYGTTNTSSYSCSWSGWSGQDALLNIKAVRAGSGTVTIYLKNSSNNNTLASATLVIKVVARAKPGVQVSASSVTVDVGKTYTVSCSVSNLSEKCTLQCSSSNTSAYSCSWGSWSNGRINLYISGKNSGSGKIELQLKNASGTILATAAISPVKVNQTAKPSVKVSKSSVSLSAGQSTNVTVSYSGCTESITLSSSTPSSICSCSWGSWSGNSIPLKITGKGAGSGTITISLKRKSDSSVLAQATINVTGTQPASAFSGYNFYNFGTDSTYDACKRMFGDTQTARDIFKQNSSRGGQCFGMSTTSSMLNIEYEAPVLSHFSGSRSKVYDLKQTDYSSSLGVSVLDFILSMQISWPATIMKKYFCGYGSVTLNDLAKAVRDSAAAKLPLCVYVASYGSAHAIVSHGYEETDTEMRVKIYDPNGPGQVRTLTLRRASKNSAYASWDFPYFNPGWGSGCPDSLIGYVPYSSFLNTWNNRGNLKVQGVLEDAAEPVPCNFLTTTESNFTIYDAGSQVVVQFVDGRPVQLRDDVTYVPDINLLPDGSTTEPVYMLYLPVAIYTVVDNSPETGMELNLANEKLAANVSTEAGKFVICADDRQNLADVTLTPEDGESYSITVGLMQPDSSGKMDGSDFKMTGTGNGSRVGLRLQNGELTVTGENDSASISTLRYDEDLYAISAYPTEGGKVITAQQDEVKAGGSYTCLIQPDEGYQISAVYVDGENQGVIDSYFFDEIDACHSITAQFVRSMDSCTIALSEDSFSYDGTEKCPEVTVTAPDGTILQPDLDYEVSYINHVNPGTASCVVTALAGSGFGGTQTADFTIDSDSESAISRAEYGEGTVSVGVAAQHGILLCAMYEGEAFVRMQTAEVQSGIETCTFNWTETVYPGRTVWNVFLVNNLAECKPLCPSRIVSP